MQRTVVVLRSSNAKIGPIPQTSRPQVTCPTDCPLMNSGCYGENRPGRPSIFDMVEKSANLTAVDAIATDAPKSAPAVRFNVVGDYLNDDGTPDTDYIEATNRVATSRPWVAIAYTHAWRTLSPDMFDYTVRASCQSEDEVREAHAAGWATVVVDPGPDAPDTLIGSIIDERTVVQCPVTTGRANSCAECRLCGRDAAVVAFPVHGSARKRAAEAIREVRGE